MHDIEMRQYSIDVWFLLMTHKNTREHYKLSEVPQNGWDNFG